MQAELRGLAAKLARQALPMAVTVGHRALADRLADFSGLLDGYLRFVDGEVIPWIEQADAWGRVRAEQLQRDQAALARTLEALRAELRVGVRPCDLPLWMERLLRSLSLTLAEARAALDTASEDAGLVVTDQMTG